MLVKLVTYMVGIVGVGYFLMEYVDTNNQRLKSELAPIADSPEEGARKKKLYMDAIKKAAVSK